MPDFKGSVSTYREFPPPAALAEYFLCLWTQSTCGARSEYAHRVLPDAGVDIVLIDDSAPMVVGPWKRAFVAHLAPGTTITGARLHPGQAASFLGLPASLLLDQRVPLSDTCGKGLSAQLARVADQRTPRARRMALAAAMLLHLPHALPADQAVADAIGWLGRHPDGRIEQLSRRAGISNRQLQRRFVQAAGYGPKMLQSVVRFQRLLHLAADAKHRRNLAQLSVDAGYADQAHMSREVRRFSDRTPAALLPSAACTLVMSDLFKTAGIESC